MSYAGTDSVKLLTFWSNVLEKVTITQLFNEFMSTYGAQRLLLHS